MDAVASPVSLMIERAALRTDTKGWQLMEVNGVIIENISGLDRILVSGFIDTISWLMELIIGVGYVMTIGEDSDRDSLVSKILIHPH